MSLPKALKLRTDCQSPEVDAKVLAWIKARSPCHFVVQHNADKENDAPHWHAILWTERDAQSMRVTLLQAVPELKRKYSIGKVGDTNEDHENYCRYMCHGDFEGDRVVIISAQAPVHSPAAMYTQAWAQDQNKRFYQTQRAFVHAAKDKNKPVVEKLIEMCTGPTSLEAITRKLVELYTKERRMMNIHNMRSQVRTAHCVLNGLPQRSIEQEILLGLGVHDENMFTSGTHERTTLDHDI